MSGALEKIEIFSAFRKAMLDYFSTYGEEEKHRRKSTVSHRIAVNLSRHFSPSCKIDIDINSTDIMVEEDGSIPLAVFWSSTYLTQSEKDKAQHFHIEKKPVLTLAFSMLEDKDYILVYRFEKEYLEYLHINKEDFSENLLKRCLIEDKKDSEQLLLDIRKKRTRKTRKES